MPDFKWFVKVDSFTNKVIAWSGRVDAEENAYHDIKYKDKTGQIKKGNFWECPNYNFVDELLKDTNFPLKLTVCRRELPNGMLTEVDVKTLFSHKRKIRRKTEKMLAQKLEGKLRGHPQG